MAKTARRGFTFKLTNAQGDNRHFKQNIKYIATFKDSTKCQVKTIGMRETSTVGYIRCDHFILTHCIIDCDVI